ncbi:MAG: chitobiase/beta-hexosaminidase C-terminal domain-containing protein, partial [Leptospiraceae bacterium]|nr:chitobiase/beta-hexosaminidase C-terminal domain-containing protein [Leptospiraceae bacterium]
MLKLLVVVFVLLLVTCKFERKKAIVSADILSSNLSPTENTTPLQDNTSSIEETISNPVPETVATPTFSPAGGTYNTDQTVTIQTPTVGASIHYTTDGTNPTTS